MPDEILKWLYGAISSAVFLSFIAYLMRSTLTKYFTRSVEYHFEKKFEKFKADIRDNEKELEQVRSFLSSARRERDSALQLKRFEAAEILLRSRQFIAEMAMLVEYIKIINVEEIVKRNKDPKIINFMNTLIAPFNIDEKLQAYKNLDRTLPNLYLSDRTRKVFETYEFIVINAVTVMKLLSLPALEINVDIFKKDSLKNMVIELAPHSKEGFDKYGDSHAYFWATYFYTEILNSLRNELLGADNMAKDTEAATRLALDSRNAHINILSTIQSNGLSTSLIKQDAGKESL